MESTIATEKRIEEYTMEMGQVNVIAFLMVFPIAIITILPFILIWDLETLLAGKNALMKFFILLLLAGIIVHELLHGVTWACFATKGFRSIKFGIKWKFLTPYCHCKEALKVKHYSIGAAMPLIVMGIIPVIIGLITGHGGILLFGIFFCWTAGGDIIALYMLRKLDREEYVSDHPDKMGFIREID